MYLQISDTNRLCVWQSAALCVLGSRWCWKSLSGVLEFSRKGNQRL